MALFTFQRYVPKNQAAVIAAQIPQGIHITLDGTGETFGGGDFLIVDENDTIVRGYGQDAFLANYVIAPA